MSDVVAWEKTHGELAKIIGQLYEMVGPLNGASSDTLFALGEVAGAIDKVKALLGRDIDEALRQ